MPTEPAQILTRCLSAGYATGKQFPRQRMLDYASASPSPVCQKFMTAIRRVPAHDLKRISFEAMCVLARVSPLEMLGAILVSARSLKATESALKTILAHPEVVQETINAACSGDPIFVGGKELRDRNGDIVRYRGDVAAQRLVHDAIGFLPRKGGVEINFGFGRPEEEREEGSDADQAWDETFPDMGSQISEWSEKKHLMLERGK